MTRKRASFFVILLSSVLGLGLFMYSSKMRPTEFILQNLRSVQTKISSLMPVLVGTRINRSYGVYYELSDYTVVHSDVTPEPYKKWIYSLHNRFLNQTSETCVNACLDADPLCQVKTKHDWDTANVRGRIRTKPLYAESRAVLPWEKEYFSLPPLMDTIALPDRRQSRIRLISDEHGVRTKNGVSCKVNRKLFFVLDLYDGNGNPRKYGGDQIRAWIRGKHNGKGSTETLRAVARVTDWKNGSYGIQVTCLWVGSIELKVGIVYPREYLRLALHHSIIGSQRFLRGLFQRGNIEEATICFGTPNIPGRPCLCNFTEINTLPFYCGRPLDKRLGCKDLRFTSQFDNPPLKNFTRAERDMASRMSRPASQTIVPHNFHITVVSDPDYPKDGRLPTRECKEVSFAETWKRSYPSGYFRSNGSWVSLMCKEAILTQSKIDQCLRNTRILLVGDSNALQLDTELVYLLGCTNYKKIKTWDFAVEKECVRQDTNTSMLFRPHEYPLCRNPKWTPSHFYGGLTKSLSYLPTHGRHIVLYHYYLHPASGHMSQFLLGLYAAKRAFVRLLRRNPRVVIGIRGPHVSYMDWVTNHLFGGDVQGAVMYDIYREVFEDMKDRIVFLDGWELTTAIENVHFHAPTFVPLSLVRTFLSFYCE